MHEDNTATGILPLCLELFPSLCLHRCYPTIEKQAKLIDKNSFVPIRDLQDISVRFLEELGLLTSKLVSLLERHFCNDMALQIKELP